MPDRPKRRKNKHKRKNNKNSNTDINKNEESETVDECNSSLAENVIKDTSIHIDGENIDITASSEVNKSTSESDRPNTSQLNCYKKVTEEVKNKQGEKQDEKSYKKILASSDICKEKEHKEKENNKTELKEDCELTQQTIRNAAKQSENLLQMYIVETPEQETTTNTKCKLDNAKKSKSCDNNYSPTIIEITDDSNVDNYNILTVTDNCNAIISGEESDIEWEKVCHFNLPDTQFTKGILSSDTIPLNIVHCEQIKSLSPQEEISLRNYLQTLNLSTSPSNLNSGDIKTEIEQIINREIKYRLRKKGLTEDTNFIRAGPCRSLAVIDEEGSGDSSKTSRRHSYLSDKKSDTEELEDDVFECKQSQQLRSSNKISMKNNSSKCLIPQPCIRVDAKLKEPEITEARGDWSIKTVEKMTGAELVYLTDSSSSTSSIYDMNDDADKGEETDVSVRMITPTIEVTDTESLLSNTFLANNNDKDNIYRPKKDANEILPQSVIMGDNNNCKELNENMIGSNIQHDTHEIVILSTDDIKTDLTVKDINESKSFTETAHIYKVENNSEKLQNSSSKTLKDTDTYDLEIKVLKCELNNAINNLIKEVISDSENSKNPSQDILTRQDSSSSLDSSQCTAKYNPTNSSLNDVSNLFQDDTNDSTNKEIPQIEKTFSHVKDVIQCVTLETPIVSDKTEDKRYKQPPKLRDICVKKITSFPFGDKILEELAHVSLRLQNMSILASEKNHKVRDSTVGKLTECKSSCLTETNVPPPILPRKSSLKITQDELIVKVTSKTDTKYECLSPSQKMLMEKTHTITENDFKSQPGSKVNIMQTEMSKRDEKPLAQSYVKKNIAPMKSETGSRLLALLRDTSISNNLNTLEEMDFHQGINLKKNSESFSKKLLDELDSSNQYTETTTSNKTSSFSTISSINYKPIPPPKPKKISTYFNESDGGSDLRGNSFREMHSNKKYFHYSTGNLNKEIEEDISSIQNMHRYCTNLRDQSNDSTPRRPSLPKDLCDQQMEYIRQKEKEVDAELRRLDLEQNYSNRYRGPRAPMISDDNESKYSTNLYSKTQKFSSTSQTHKNIEKSKLSSLFSSSQEELLREKMYSEYVNQMTEREQRRQQKVLKITQPPISSSVISKSMPLLDHFDSKMNNRIEQEFISKAKERWYKLGIRDPETEDEKDIDSDVYVEPKVIEHKIKVIEAGEEKDVAKLPSHMQEFVKFTVKDKEQDSGSTGESNADKTSTHVVVFCAVIILVLTVGKFLLQLIRNK